MTVKISTGLRNKMLDTGSFKSIFAASFIKIYAGTVPADADAAIGGATLLCTISIAGAGTGVNMDTASVAGVLSKAPAEVWSGINGASGTATFYRHVAAGDTGASSTTEARTQGTVGTVGADFNMASTALVNGVSQPIDNYVVTLPSF